jgi:hypothetical protein
VIGSLAFYVSGPSEEELRTGLDIAVSDSESAASSLETLRSFIERQGSGEVGPPPSGADEGFTTTFDDGSLEVALTGEELTVSIAGADAGEPSGSLAESDLFAAATEALGDDYEPQTYLGVQDLLGYFEQDFDYQSDLETARPYTEDITYAIFGTRSDDDRTVSRFVVGVE